MASAKMGIKVEKSPPESRIEELGARKWDKYPEIPVSKFPWTFEETEKCYFLEGKLRVYPDGPHDDQEDYVEVNGGDLVEFPKGLKCIWDVIQPINKHYIHE